MAIQDGATNEYSDREHDGGQETMMDGHGRRFIVIKKIGESTREQRESNLDSRTPPSFALQPDNTLFWLLSNVGSALDKAASNVVEDEKEGIQLTHTQQINCLSQTESSPL